MSEAVIADTGRNEPNLADPRLAKVVEARMAGKSWQEISNELRIPPRSLWTLRADYDVDGIVSQLNQDAFEALTIGHVELMAKARDVLRELLTSEDERVRLAAALKLYPDPSGTGPARGGKRLKELSDGELGQRAVAALAGRRSR